MRDPTTEKERFPILDVLRGLALAGIALANYPEFALWTFLSSDEQAMMPTAEADRMVRFLQYALVDGKFYTIFSLLFGVGFSLILSRHSVSLFMRRMLILAAIGFCHLMFLWSGDILLLYAAGGMLLPLFIRLGDSVLLAIAVLLIVVPVGLDALTEFADVDFAAPFYQLWWTQAAKEGITEENFASWLRDADGYGAMFAFLKQGACERMWEFVSGHRLLKVLGLFIIGYLIGKRRLYARLGEFPLKRLLTGSLAIALPASLLYAWSAVDDHPWGLTVHSLLYAVSVIPLAFCYILGVCLLFVKRGPSLLMLASPGRMALTCYIFQSVIGILLFYGLGLGLGTTFGLVTIEATALVVFFVQTVLCRLWLRYFRFGPLEWLWRMLTYGHYFPMMKRYVVLTVAMLMGIGMWAQPVAGVSALAESLRDKADSLYNNQQYDDAKAVALEGLDRLDRAASSDDVTRGDLLNLLSMINVRQGHFEDAAKYAKQCNELDLKSGDPDMISSSYNTLTGIYMSMRQPKEAEKYILKALDYAKKADNPQRKAVLLGMASEVYHKMNREEQSLDYATKSYQLEQQLGRCDKMAVRQAQRAASLISLERYAEAEEALGEAIPGLRESGNRHSLGIACNQMGQLMHQQQNDSAAVRYFNEALTIFLDQQDLYNESQSRKGLYEALRTTDPALAMQHNDRYLELRDSIYDSETGELLSKYAAEYGNYELQTENLEMQRAHRLYIIIGVAVLTLILLGWLLHYLSMRSRNRRQQQVNAQLQESLDKLTEEKRRLNHQEEKVMSDESREFQLKIIDIVNQQMETGNVSVDALASELCLSTTQLRSRISELTGETPQNYVLGIRMQKARHLMIAHPSLTMGEIALRCAYEEKASFSRAFKRYFGMSPTEYVQFVTQNPQ